MPKMKVSDLEGESLDYAVAKCEGRSYTFSISTGGDYNGNTTHGHVRNYSSNWSLAGPIIDREFICIKHGKFLGKKPSAMIYEGDGYISYEQGSTPLIAAMRCYVASKYGREIEIPEILT